MNKIKAVIVGFLVLAGLLIAPVAASSAQSSAQASSAKAVSTITMYRHSNLGGSVDWQGNNYSECQAGAQNNRIWSIYYPASITVSSLRVNSDYKYCNTVGLQSGSAPHPWTWRCIRQGSSVWPVFPSSPGAWYNDNVIYAGLGYTPNCPLYR